LEKYCFTALGVVENLDLRSRNLGLLAREEDTGGLRQICTSLTFAISSSVFHPTSSRRLAQIVMCVFCAPSVLLTASRLGHSLGRAGVEDLAPSLGRAGVEDLVPSPSSLRRARYLLVPGYPSPICLPGRFGFHFSRVFRFVPFVFVLLALANISPLKYALFTQVVAFTVYANKIA
jgi:hypothetical protein